ncbi:hypothetical protein LY78DRAFT_729086 [Colletotrichum sublineola]|nr:hypothetical protein LY78DRAFT_729086 [Colletotrichum sublineola]
METSTDDFELKKSMMSSQIRTLRDVMEGQFRRTLTQLVETHENDRKGNFNRFLIRASLNHSADVFRQLESSIRDEFPKYISALNYFQGGSVSIRFTNDPPPGGWEPMLVDMDQIFGPVDSPVTDVPNDMAASSESGPILPSSRPQPTNRKDSSRKKAPRRERTSATPRARVKKSQTSSRRPTQDPPRPKKSTRKPRPKRVGGFIKTSVATRKIPDNPSWAFSYDLGEGLRYFILECPIRGCQVSFSTNPLKNKLAATHFEQCNVPFSDEEDIVRRFARQLQPQRTDNEATQVTKAWVDNHNRQVSRQRKEHHRIEGRPASESPDVISRLSTESFDVSPRDTGTIQV